MADSLEPVKKITEKSETARREFFKKVEKIIQSHGHSDKLMQDTADRAAQEYMKVFGRLGVHPLLHLKGGKKPPRYIIDRDEVWVIYKPPLWQMGGSETSWKRNVEKLVNESTSLQGAQNTMLKTDKAESMQEWHGLTQGMMWMDLDKEVSGWGFIQRLDLETDGPVIIAKTWRAQRCLQVQMREHIFTKGYLCLVHGRLENHTAFVKCRFGELGSEAATQVMLKHDNENDPFFDWVQSGRWRGRQVKPAETFYKPLAYFGRKEDNSEYTLVYVNIISGITHQVRITMQSVGHPVVSDDRYLPKDQALADLKWCPRNFLVEVRSDFFDMCGPYKDEERRRFTRISIENPLPKLFQNILENKLTLIEKLDPLADLNVGPQYWAIGDEQLMSAYPKDSEYRRKVMRWGQRRGIHLDALDRLLLLPKEEIDPVLTNYKAPSEKGDVTWVCPECMSFNQPDGRKETSGMMCPGYFGNVGKECPGTRTVDEDATLPKGWLNYAADPTIHLLFQINGKWLEARRKIVKYPRPSWEKPPAEAEGSMATPDVMLVLEAALVLNAKAGGSGLREEDLKAVPGLEDVKMPLADFPESANVTRVRQPGCGTMSQWLYTLKGKERIKHVAEFNTKCRKLGAPVPVKADSLPAKMVITKSEKEKKARLREKELKRVEAEEAKKEDDDDLPASKKAKTSAKWSKTESKSNPGKFYYVNSETGETSVDKPADFEEKKPIWSRVESKSNPGQFYYHNSETDKTIVERPAGVEILNDVKSKSAKEEEEEDEGIDWERRESKTKPGNFYYFNPKTGANEIHPPRVELPWKLLESKTKKGQFYYFNEDTGENDVNPPPSARAATKASEKGTEKGKAENGVTQKSSKAEKLPNGWVRKESESHPGKYYYRNTKTGESSWTRPSDWEKQESASNPGAFYWVNAVTGETTWDKKVAMNGK